MNLRLILASCTLLVLTTMIVVIDAQLIIDGDDPASRPLIEMMMKAINEHEKINYHFENVVYSLPIGDEQKISVLLKVSDAKHVIHSCTVELIGKGKDHASTDIANWTTGAVVCKSA